MRLTSRQEDESSTNFWIFCLLQGLRLGGKFEFEADLSDLGNNSVRWPRIILRICKYTPTGQTFAHTDIKNKSELVSHGCRNKLPQTRWLIPRETYHHPVLESRSPKSNCLKCWFLLEALRKRIRILWALRKNAFIPCLSFLQAILEVPWAYIKL